MSDSYYDEVKKEVPRGVCFQCKRNCEQLPFKHRDCTYRDLPTEYYCNPVCWLTKKGRSASVIPWSTVAPWYDAAVAKGIVSADVIPNRRELYC